MNVIRCVLILLHSFVFIGAIHKWYQTFFQYFYSPLSSLPQNVIFLHCFFPLFHITIIFNIVFQILLKCKNVDKFLIILNYNFEKSSLLHNIFKWLESQLKILLKKTFVSMMSWKYNMLYYFFFFCLVIQVKPNYLKVILYISFKVYS